MSIYDRTATARSFSQTSQTGYDRVFACTNPAANTGMVLSDKQTRPTKNGALNSVLRQVQIRFVDPTTLVESQFTANITLKWPNNAPNPSEHLQNAFVVCSRSIFPADSATIVGTATETNLKNIQIGAMPTP